MGFTETRALDIYYGADRKPRNANGDLIGFIGEDVKGSHLASEIRFHFPESADLAETYSITIVAKRADGQLRFDVCERVVDAEIGTYYKAEFNNWYNEKHGTLTLSVKVYKGEVTITEGVITPSAGTSIIVGTTFTFDVKYAPTPTTQVAADELSTLELILLAVETRPVFDDIIRVVYVMPDLTELDENDNPRYDTRMFLLVNEENTTLYYIDGSTAVEANIGTTIAKLLDTDIDSLVSGDVLSWNGSKWENSTRLSTAEITIASNVSRIGTNEGNINALDVRVGANEDDIEDIEDGTIIVAKAYADEDGVNIKENYVRISDDPNTPVLDENNKLPNSYLQDDVPLIENKNSNGLVFWNATLGKLDTNADTLAISDGIIGVYQIRHYLHTGTRISFNPNTSGHIQLTATETGSVPLLIVENYHPNATADLARFVIRSNLGVPTIAARIKGDGTFETTKNILIAGNLNIAGDIIQQGSAYETHAEHIYTTKDHIILRDGAVGGLAVGAYAGLFAKLADGTNDSALVFDGNGIARVGDITYSGSTPNYSNTQALATRQDSPTSSGIAYWNASANRFDTSSGLITDLGDNANAGLIINKSAGAGNIANFQFSGANKLEITKDGYFTINGARLLNYTNNGNTYLGKYSGTIGSAGDYNTAIGYAALNAISSGNNNIGIGANALYAATTGSNNIGIGRSALLNLVGSYSSNIAIGFDAARYYNDGTDKNKTQGSAGIYIGGGIKGGATNDSSNEIVIGYNAIGQGSNSVVLGNTNITKTILRGNVGIGTESPSWKLHLYNGGLDTRLRLQGSRSWDFISGNATTSEYTPINGFAIRDANIGANRVVIDQNGLVGINQTSPTSQLHIVSSAKDKVGLIVDMPASPTENIQEWKVAGTTVAFIDKNGSMNGASVSIVDTHSQKIESTFGEFNPQSNGVPIVQEIQGRTIPALENLVENGGNPFTATTNWLSEGGNLTVSSNNLLHTSTSNQTFPAVRPNTDIFLANNVYYTITRVSVNLTKQSTITLRLSVSPFTAIATQATPTNNTFYILKGSILPTTNGRQRIDVPVVSGDTISIAYMMSFNLTASHGVTTTSGPAYDNAVADIEAMLEANGGYISTTPTTHLENTEIKSVGKNLFDKSDITLGQRLNGSGGFTAETSGYVSNYIKINNIYTYYLSNYTNVQRFAEYYDLNKAFISNQLLPNISFNVQLIIPNNAFYVRFSGQIDSLNTAQLEQGTSATTYAPYITETQKFNHTALRSTIDKSVRDKIRYNNGAYVLDRYVNSADNTALATPLLATEVIDVDGVLLQDSVTTLEQLQTIPTTFSVDYAVNTAQTTATLVKRDKIQQLELDTIEAKLETSFVFDDNNLLTEIKGQSDTDLQITRNVADADNTYAALKINNAQGNGDIVKFQYNGTTKASINKDGVLVDNNGSAGTDGQVLTKVSGEMLWANVEDATARMISTTYADLVSARNAGTLIAGTFYRITDYTCTTTQSNTQSGGNVFDIIVMATDDDTLSEDARAILHNGDTYFASSNLNAWELKYSLTNDTSRFYWADTSTGKGVIYFMKDEFENECGYDFKNIQYLVGETYVYTFSDASLTGDDSLDGSFKNNKIGSYYYSGTYRLGKNIFKGGCTNNRFINNCHDNTFGINCDRNTLDNCYSVEFGIHCDNNRFEDAHTYLFGDYCSNNSVIGSNTCSFGDYYVGMTINRYVVNVQGSVDGTISSIFMYITIESPMIGTSAESKLDICFTGLPNRSYPTTFTRDANGKYIAKWHSALLTMAGKYKDDATDTTWGDIS